MKGATLVTSDFPAPTTYTPLLALPWWDTLGPFLTALVDDVSAELGVAPRSLYSFLTQFVLWCWQTKALDLDRQTMFRRSRIESFIINGMPGLNERRRTRCAASCSASANWLSPSHRRRRFMASAGRLQPRPTTPRSGQSCTPGPGPAEQTLAAARPQCFSRVSRKQRQVPRLPARARIQQKPTENLGGLLRCEEFLRRLLARPFGRADRI